MNYRSLSLLRQDFKAGGKWFTVISLSNALQWMATVDSMDRTYTIIILFSAEDLDK